jgi:sugar lactone lactonase YvrE
MGSVKGLLGHRSGLRADAMRFPILRIGSKAVVTLLCVALAACGGGGGGGSSAPAASPPPAVVAPTISAQPQVASVPVGQSVSFSVTAAGTAPLTYQWTRAGAAITAATGATYTIASPALADNAAVFAVTVKNSAGSVTSANAMLTVGAPPTVATAPASATVGIGSAANFSVVAAGTGPFTYQWLKNGVAIAGAASASYALTAPTVADSGAAFSVAITSSFGTVTSAVAALRVTGISVLAGTPGGAGYVDGPLANARFTAPYAITADTNGNLFIADGSTIREVSASGTVSTLAGSRSLNGSTDGPAASALFYYPGGLTVDPAGTLYIADTGNSTVRLLKAGTVSTIGGLAGTGGGVTGTIAQSRFSSPFGIAVNPQGLVYVSDADYGTVASIDLSTSTVAPFATGLSYPSGLAFTPQFSLLVADEESVASISTAGTVTRLAGTPGVMGSADGAGAAASFSCACSIATDSGGNAYIADLTNDNIRFIAAGGDTVTTLAGAALSAGYVDGAGASARFDLPYGIATDPAGNAYIADYRNSVIRKMTSTGVTSTFAGTAPHAGSTDGTGSAARFREPRGIAADSAGNLYVSDTDNQTIRKITPAGVVSTFAGAAGQAGFIDGSATTARFNGPRGLAFGANGLLYVADAFNHVIRVISPQGAVSTLAGSATNIGNIDGTGAAAGFSYPIDLAVDGSGNVFVTDNREHTIRKITPTGVTTTFAGTAASAGALDGAGAAARFNGPLGIVIDGQGTIYVGDSGNGTLRAISASAVVSTLAGTALKFGAADGTGAGARFASLYGLGVDAAGNIYVADNANSAIREVTPSGVVTTVAGSLTSASAQLTAGPLPGLLNSPWGVLVLKSSPTTLLYTEELEDSIVRIDLP